MVRQALVLLVHPVGIGWGPVGQVLGLEPEGDLLLGRLNSIRAVANVATNLKERSSVTSVRKVCRAVAHAYLDTKVSSDGSGLGVDGVGLSQHDATGLDHVEAFPDHGNNGAGGHILDKAGEERTRAEVSIMLLQMLLRGLKEYVYLRMTSLKLLYLHRSLPAEKKKLH